MAGAGAEDAGAVVPLLPLLPLLPPQAATPISATAAAAGITAAVIRSVFMFT